MLSNPVKKFYDTAAQGFTAIELLVYESPQTWLVSHS